MAKLIIKHGMTEMRVEETETLINQQQKMFLDFLAAQGVTSKLSLFGENVPKAWWLQSASSDNCFDSVYRQRLL